MKRVRSKNTSFSTDEKTFWRAKELAAKEKITLSQLVDRALLREVKLLEEKYGNWQAAEVNSHAISISS